MFCREVLISQEKGGTGWAHPEPRCCDVNTPIKVSYVQTAVRTLSCLFFTWIRCRKGHTGQGQAPNKTYYKSWAICLGVFTAVRISLPDEVSLAALFIRWNLRLQLHVWNGDSIYLRSLCMKMTDCTVSWHRRAHCILVLVLRPNSFMK
jgi:hypothetical protein